MRKKWWLFLVVPPGIVLFFYLFGELVMHLWNWLLPPLFGFHAITFWQGMGLLLLGRIFFGSWTGGPDRRHRGPGMHRHCDPLTPEEREKFRQGMRHRWFGHRGPAPDPIEPA